MDRASVKLPCRSPNGTVCGVESPRVATSFGVLIAEMRSAVRFGPGWTEIGTFDLAAGEVSLSVSDRTEANVVIVDAIRWYPLDEVDE